MSAADRALLLREIGKAGDVTYGGILDTLWDAYASAADLFTMSQYLYTKRHALAVLLGEYYNYYDTEEIDVAEKESQKFNNLFRLYESVGSLIGSCETDFSVNTLPLLTLIRKATPLEYADRYVDPSSVLLTGSPMSTAPFSLDVSDVED